MTVIEPTIVDDLEALFDLDDGNPGPGDNYAHMIDGRGVGAPRIIAAAIASRTELVAMCGYRWIPTGRDPDRLPVCQACMKAWGQHHGSDQ